MVLTWLFGTISSSLLIKLVKPKRSAHDVWLCLEKLFLDKERKGRQSVMEKELLKAAAIGDVAFLKEALIREMEKGSNEYFLGRTCAKNNIIHIAVRHQRLEFVQAAVMNFPELVTEKNCDGNTSLHIAAEVGNIKIVEILVVSYNGVEDEQPWNMKNSNGNTPLHVALIHGKVEVARYLVSVAPEVAYLVNNSNEVPLHLAVKYHVDGDKDLAIATTAILNRGGVCHEFKGCVLGDDSLSIVQSLLEINSSLASWRDADGLTPLLRASMNGYLAAIKAIIEHCPQAADMSDNNGRTILHLIRILPTYNAGKDLLSIMEIGALKDQQDNDGNTPAHMAISNGNINLLKVLMGFSANFTLRNNKGLSAGALIQDLPQSFLDITTSQIDEMLKTVDQAPPVWPDKFFDQRNKLNWELIAQTLEDSALSLSLFRTSSGGNIIHRILQWLNDIPPSSEQDSETELHCHSVIMNKVLQKFPFLICQVDTKGNTPLHVVAESKRHELSSFISKCKEYFIKAQETKLSQATELYYCPPWFVKNLEGMTPLHIIMSHQSQSIMNAFVELDYDLLETVINNESETPLHIFCRYADYKTGSWTMCKLLVSRSSRAAFMRDKNGLTPVMRAAEARKLELVKLLCKHHPQSAEIRGHQGETLWHLLRVVGNIDSLYVGSANEEGSIQPLLQHSTMKSLMKEKDDNGNTPLHTAFQRGEFELAKVFIEEDPSMLLLARNNKGVTPADLIAALEQVPRKFEQYLWTRERRAMIGIRSMYGFPTVEIKEYSNTIAVIAVLLATITFTAAFTVPGGIDSNNKGAPLLLKEQAFQAFIVSDILGLCLSMMILFCSLWVIATGNRRESVLLVDFSLFLLQTSFYATLLSFMTGVYVTTIHITPWIAISTCVLCSLMIFFMRKRLVVGIVTLLFETIGLYFHEVHLYV